MPSVSRSRRPASTPSIPARPTDCGVESLPFETRKLAILLGALCAVLGVAGCQKMERRLHEVAPAAGRPGVSPLHVQTKEAAPEKPKNQNPYEGNSYAVNEGHRLFGVYNCTGCHSRGGGGIGPALMDKVWIYGKNPADIYATIVGGRPNGMPSWGDKIPEYQIWQIVTYVQALDGDRSITAPPGPREEHLQAGEGESSR
jgi:cytochrome c oxidase cbb3-type subunit III